MFLKHLGQEIEKANVPRSETLKAYLFVGLRVLRLLISASNLIFQMVCFHGTIWEVVCRN